MAGNDTLVPRFFKHVAPNPTKSQAQGRPIFDEYDAVELRMPGNRMTVGVFPAHEAEPNATRQAGEEGTPYASFQPGEKITYAMVYKRQYDQYKALQEQDVAGTPLSELPFLTEGRRKELRALNIHTAEQLAALDGAPLKQLGMGGRENKNQAAAYLAQAAGTADVTAMAQQIEQLKAQIRERDELIENYSTVRTERKYKREAAEADRRITDEFLPPDEEPITLDPDGNPPSDETPAESPFADWDKADIKNWITEAGGEVPKGNVSKAKLIEVADELNAGLDK